MVSEINQLDAAFGPDFVDAGSAFKGLRAKEKLVVKFDSSPLSGSKIADKLMS
jgi:hypothetical protein